MVYRFRALLARFFMRIVEKLNPGYSIELVNRIIGIDTRISQELIWENQKQAVLIATLEEKAPIV